MSTTKTPMTENEFYSMYEKKRILVDASTIEVKDLERTSKTGKVTVRYQAVGADAQGRKVYKFINSETAARLRD